MKLHAHRLLTTVILLLIVPMFVSTAQWIHPSKSERPDLYVTIQDSLSIYLVSGEGITINPNEVHAGYVFDMLYDSTSLIMYTFTECLRNSQRIKLAKWINDRTVNANAALLSYNSTTDTFTCRAGDTLSFYRELLWRNPQTGRFNTSIYYALDSLDYAVELVRTSDSGRAVLLDSIGILANFTPSRPVIHGMHPLLALVRYVVPPSLNNVKAFIRVRVYHRGNGEYWFTRHDWFNIALSAQLTDSIWTNFINLFSPGSSKIITHDATQNELLGNSNLVVDNIAGSPRDIQITFEAAADGGGTAIAIYDIFGEELFIPYMTPGSDGQARTYYHFDRSGTYFVGLLHANHLNALRKIIIN